MCEPRFAIRKQAEAAVVSGLEVEVKGAQELAHRLDNAVQATFDMLHNNASILYMDWRF